ncbi:MAG: LamG domain-containing protein [Polyangiaceae bacterium]
MRRACLVVVAAVPIACSVYGPSDLQGWVGGQGGAGGDAAGQANAAAGTASNDGSNGGGASHAAGTTGEGGSIGGRAPDMAGAGGAPSLGAAGEAGGPPEIPSGGRSTGASGAGGAGADAGGASTAGAAGTAGIAGLVASYPCESASGAVLADSSGRGKNATLANGSGGSLVGFSFGTGKVGNALTLSSKDQAYVSLPRGLLSHLSEATIATWVKLKAGTAFQRIFDFGIDTNTYMYLVNSSSSGFVRFRIVSSALSKNQVLEGAQAVPVGRWTHVAVAVGNTGVFIYIDGAQVAQQAPAALRPSDLGDTGNNFIGRSPFASDPYLDGQVDEFRIYNRVLSGVEIAALANGQ